ncbi:MAG: hypothetical protein DLM53_07520 [Candidatus Eremiobacter antarcticus]|nr:AAA family ATPase [Candidatus Eremiobacteraeota bacterium]MBC5807223.1 AAA family ATPase [Candidatus Eremiobacteraeota bacterium]PZR61906.1 MAG: hypothetical protein DLM53_07520 [Candidatus Eremiobacter sp. RRmetagenome_bin22]
MMGGPRLDIRLLGHPQVSFGGAIVRLPKRAVTIPLAAYLLLHRERDISRNALAFTLWADESEETALAELRRYVYLLNKTLPPRPNGQPWIRAEGDMLRWHFDDAMRLDVADFERLSADPSTCAEAVEVYAGDLLEDSYDDWVVSYRERLRALYFTDLSALISSHRAARRFSSALLYAARLLAADPWREDIVRITMACQYESGGAAAAIATFDGFAKRLKAELGVEPMPETLVVRDAIVRSAPLPESLGALNAGAGLERPPPGDSDDGLPFGGRQNELEQLRAFWMRSARGNGSLVLVSGEAGIGKSRLVAELARSIDSEGGRICLGVTTCPERFPYECIVEALRYSLPYVATLDLDPLRLSIIASLIPELAARRPDLPEIPPLDPSREQARLLDAVASTISAMALPRPLCIIFEDLHWARAATLSAIAFLARRLAKSAVLLVGTYREEEAGRTHPLRAVHRELRGEHLVHTLALKRLSRPEVFDIVERMPISAGKRPELARLGFERSEGNPLFLTEALRDGVRAGESVDANGHPWNGSEILRTTVAARLASLSEEGREIAQVAAVAGHGFDVDLIREVAGTNESSILDGVNELMDRHLVREAGVRRRYDYAFTHHLIQEAIYEMVEPALRTRRHRRIAQLLEAQITETSGFAASDLALHWERGGDDARAASRYLSAAAQAAALFANDEAIGYATKTLALAVDDRTRSQALLVRELTFGKLGQREAQASDIEALRALSERNDDNELSWQTLMRTLQLQRSLGDREKQAETVDQLERRAAAGSDPRRRARALLARAEYLVGLTDHAQAEKPAEEALALYERLGDNDGQVETLAMLVEVVTSSGNAERSRQLLAALRSRAAGQPDKTLILRAVSAGTTAALQQHRIGDAAELAHEALALSRSIGDREEEANALERLATVATFQSDFEAARQLFAQAADAMQSIGNARGMSHVLANHFVLALRLGLLAEADQLGARVLAIVERTGDRRPLAVTKVNMSLSRLLQGDSDDARRLASEALQIAKEIKFPLFEGAALANLGNAERTSGSIRNGVRHLEQGLALRKGMLDPMDLLDDYCDLAIGYVQMDELGQARATADTLLEIAGQTTEGAFWPHYCYWAAAIVGRARGDRAQSELHLQNALMTLRNFAHRVADAETRAAFFALPLNREIVAAGERDEWPSYAGGSPARYTPVGRHKKRR